MTNNEKDEAIDYFCNEVIAGMNSISASSTKVDLLASISHWKVLISNIKSINKQ